jgi:outer membrane protein assembly factor BamA
MTMNRGGSFTWRALFRYKLICSAVFMLAILLPRTLAQSRSESEASARLDSLAVTGSARFHSEQIVPTTGLHIGATVTLEDLQAAANRLAQLGPFSAVHYSYTSEETGVKVEYQVTDEPGVPVWFDNFPWFSDAELTAAIEKSVSLFDGMAPMHGTVLDDISHSLENLLATRGVNATVSHALAMAPMTQQRVQLFRVEGGALNVASVEFSDSLAQTDPGIRERLSDIVGKPYSRSATQIFEFEQIRPVYLAHAFLHVQFAPPSVRIADGAGASAAKQAVIIAPINAGPAYSWNGVTWTGNSSISSAELATLVPLKLGGPANGMKIEATWQSVLEAYARRGYLDVALKPTPEFDEFAKGVAYTVQVTEGPQYRMGNMVLTGLSMEGERRIRAAWKIAPGAVFDKSAYDEFLTSGIKMAFTGLPYHYEKIGRFLQEDPKDGKVDVLLDFQ